jgi:predicted membrane protein (TIGR00267 family)
MKQKNRFSRLEIVPLARRYIVMNSFDGVLTALAIMISQIATKESSIVFHAGIASGLGLAISGITSAYMAEKAERDIEIENLERAMLSELKGRREDSRLATLLLAIVNGIAPMLAVLLVISPFAFLAFGPAFIISVLFCCMLLFSLGVYLARISDKSMVLYGLQMLIAGIVTAALVIGITYAA